MAEITHTFSQTQNGDVLVTWASVSESDTFEEIDLTSRKISGMTAQVSGTFGSATIAIQGSNDDTTYATIDDFGGAAASATAAAVIELGARPLYIKPLASGGTGQSVDVKLLIRAN